MFPTSFSGYLLLNPSHTMVSCTSRAGVFLAHVLEQRISVVTQHDKKLLWLSFLFDDREQYRII
jgi:hypothetical protein